MVAGSHLKTFDHDIDPGRYEFDRSVPEDAIDYNLVRALAAILIINSFSIFSLPGRISNGTAGCFVSGEAVAGQGGFSGSSAVAMVRRSALQSWNTA